MSPVPVAQPCQIIYLLKECAVRENPFVWRKLSRSIDTSASVTTESGKGFPDMAPRPPAYYAHGPNGMVYMLFEYK